MITIEKAIETLTSVARGLIDTNATGELDAVKLGIEALKRLKKNRDLTINFNFRALPGETEE